MDANNGTKLNAIKRGALQVVEKGATTVNPTKKKKKKKKKTEATAKTAPACPQQQPRNSTTQEKTFTTRLLHFLRDTIPPGDSLLLTKFHSAIKTHNDAVLRDQLLGNNKKSNVGAKMDGLLAIEELSEFQRIGDSIERKGTHPKKEKKAKKKKKKAKKKTHHALEDALTFEPSLSSKQIQRVADILAPVTVNPGVDYWKCVPGPVLRLLTKELPEKKLLNHVLKECMRKSTDDSGERYWEDDVLRAMLQNRVKERYEALWHDHARQSGPESAAIQCVEFAKHVVHEELAAQDHGGKLSSTELGFLVCTTSLIRNVANKQALPPKPGDNWKHAIAKAVVALAPDDHVDGMKITNMAREETPSASYAAAEESEDHVKQLLTQLGVSFVDEAALQRRELDRHIAADQAGKDYVEVTPDFELTSPVTVRGQSIKWIEVKRTLTIPGLSAEYKIQYLSKQLHKYATRYEDEGGGLVIWTHCGFAAGLEEIPGVVHAAMDAGKIHRRAEKKQQQQAAGKTTKKKKKAKKKKKKTNKVPIPDKFCCPILRELMVDPVVTSDGHTYEKRAILHWLKTSDKSPKTNQRLQNKDVVPNHLLRRDIVEFRERHGIPKEKKWAPEPIAAPPHRNTNRGMADFDFVLTMPSLETMSSLETMPSRLEFDRLIRRDRGNVLGGEEEASNTPRAPAVTMTADELREKRSAKLQQQHQAAMEEARKQQRETVKEEGTPKEERLERALKALMCYKSNDVGMKALAFVQKILEHIVQTPMEEKYRHLRNPKMIKILKEKVTSRPGGESLLLLSGFAKHQEDGTFAMAKSDMDVAWIGTVVARVKEAEDALKEEKEEKERDRAAAAKRSAQKTAAEVVYEEAKERLEKRQDAASVKAEKERLMLELGLLLEKEKGEKKGKGGGESDNESEKEKGEEKGNGGGEKGGVSESGESDSESDSDNESGSGSGSSSSEESSESGGEEEAFTHKI
jgi:hypothetical protein